MVLMPSEKSCVSTAMVTMIPTSCEAWNCQTDGDAVEQAVGAQHTGGERSAGCGVAVKEQNAVQYQVR